MESLFTCFILFVCMITRSLTVQTCKKSFRTVEPAHIYKRHGVTGTISKENHESFNVTSPKGASFRLNVTNTSPAVLNSIIKFHAEIDTVDSHPADPKMFEYLWHNDADHKLLKTMDDWTATADRTFSLIVNPGKYAMHVCVYDKTVKWNKHKNMNIVNHDLVAEGVTEFVLTSTLNGHANLEEDLEHHDKCCLATHRMINFTVDVTDRFDFQPDRKYYRWYNGDKRMAQTFSPHYSFMLNKTEDNVTLSVCAYYIVFEETSEKLRKRGSPKVSDIQLEKLNKEPCEGVVGISKAGWWQKVINIKDEVNSVNVSGLSTVQTDETLNLTISFTGSDPTEVCWSLCEIEADREKSCSNYTCFPPIITESSCMLQLHVPDAGKFRVRIIVKNGVSLVHASHEVQAHYPEQPSSTNYTVPILFGCIAFVILAIGFVKLLRQKKKRHVEEADFDFHSSPGDSRTHPLIAKTKDMFHMFVTSITSPKHRNRGRRKTYIRYGSLNETSDEDLNGSL